MILKQHGRGNFAIRFRAGLCAAARMDRSMAGRRARSSSARQRLVGDRGIFNALSLSTAAMWSTPNRPLSIAPSPRSKNMARASSASLEADGPDIASLESELKKHAPKIFLPHPRFSKPGGRNLLARKTKTPHCPRRALQFLDRRRRALSSLALSRQRRADSVLARAASRSASRLVHQTYYARVCAPVI